MIHSGPRYSDVFDVWEDVDILYQSPRTTDTRNTKYIFMGEDHSRRMMQYDHSRIIDHTITPGSILLVEGCSALIEVTGEDRKRILEQFKISEYAQKMLTVIGWDRFNHLRPPRTVFLCKYDPDTGDSSILLDEEASFPLGERGRMLEEAKAFIKAASYDDTRITQVAKETAEAIKKHREEIAETFPNRTAAMVHTLKVLEQRGEEIKGKVFLIAGFHHVQDAQSTFGPRFSLRMLYEILPTLNVIVIASKVRHRPLVLDLF